ncbi:hypothetical protein H696_04271 [Fonticula alba]|uniref:Nucleoporin Nup54 alpha-helical domain-containing protein n=1 Tax=Fonticula alba TaxID=691883 RepID=A0A058Z4K1_FONAL|nr:hypothetical protein H696_04271 [Fonticula alba]KCV68853.1 hypothetical protein H696_04271 [Fonticula alba]|eukprot:XP_009496424.1 hypothetical protein H696_04271 [Fonticula alba]
MSFSFGTAPAGGTAQPAASTGFGSTAFGAAAPSASSGTSFGSTVAPAAGGTSFGSTSFTNPPTSGSTGLGGAAPAAGSSGFGGFGGFGAAAPAAGSSSGFGGFGASAPATGSTSGFGASTSGFGASTSGFGASTSGFGASTSGFGASGSGFGASGSGFGASGSGFGASGSGFGASGSGFGASTSGFGGTTGWGQAPAKTPAQLAQEQQQQNLMRIHMQQLEQMKYLANLPKSARFSDLTTDQKQILLSLYETTKKVRQTLDELSTSASSTISCGSLDYQTQSVLERTDALEVRHDAVRGLLKRNAWLVDGARDATAKLHRDLEKAQRLLERLGGEAITKRNHQGAPAGTSGVGRSSGDAAAEQHFFSLDSRTTPALMTFFENLVGQLEDRMLAIRQDIATYETTVSSLDSSMYASMADVKDIIKAQNESMIAVAERLAAAHSAVEVARDAYLRLRRLHLNDTHDPFAAARRRKREFESAGPNVGLSI